MHFASKFSRGLPCTLDISPPRRLPTNVDELKHMEAAHQVPRGEGLRGWVPGGVGGRAADGRVGGETWHDGYVSQKWRGRGAGGDTAGAVSSR